MLNLIKNHRSLKKLPNYISAFKFIAGLRLFFQIEGRYSRHSNKIRSFNVPGLLSPVFLRDSLVDHSIFWQCLVKQQYDIKAFPQYADLMATYNSMLGNGCQPLIIDCGGNIGLSTIWFATNFPKAKIFTLEPDQNNLDILHLNTDAYKDRVTVIPGGIWSEHGKLYIANPQSGSAAFRVEFLPNGNEGINAYTIDDICKMANEVNPLIIKLDIEGSQANLFSTNTAWVGRTHLISLELDDWLMPWQGTSRSFFKCLSNYPFDYLLSGESIFCFRDSRT